MREALAEIVREANGPTDAFAGMYRWALEHEQDPELVERIYQPALQADLAGRLFVVEIEFEGQAPIALADGELTPFLRMPFREAIAEFIRRGTTEGGGLGILTPEEFYALSDAYRTRAFTASRLMSEELVRQAYDALQRALEEGSTLRDFARSLGEGDVVAGQGSTGYLETVFRTNVQGAYGAGRYRQIRAVAQDPDLAAARPFVEYRTAGDTRVRQNHAALDRTVFRIDDPDWGRFAPPSGFNCRCSVVTRRARDVDPSQVRGAGDVPDDAQPDPGFDAPPAPEL